MRRCSGSWATGARGRGLSPPVWRCGVLPPSCQGLAQSYSQLLLFIPTGPINAAIVNLLGDVPTPILIGRLSDATSLGHAVLLVPVAVALAGAVWCVTARVSAGRPLPSLGAGVAVEGLVG